MKKKIFDVMKLIVVEALEGTKVELIGIEDGERANDDGTKEKFTRLECEIPRGNRQFSRCRFSCKTDYSPNCFTLEELDEGVLIILHGLTITYLDNRGNVYFRCDSFCVAEEND